MYHPQGTPQPLSPQVGTVFPLSVSCSRDISRPDVWILSLSTYLVHHSFQFLNTKLPRKEAKTSVHVLTSDENHMMLEEKEKKKRKRKECDLQERNRKKKEPELKRLEKESSKSNSN